MILAQRNVSHVNIKNVLQLMYERETPVPPCVLRTTLFLPCVLRIAIFWPRILRTV